MNCPCYEFSHCLTPCDGHYIDLPLIFLIFSPVFNLPFDLVNYQVGSLGTSFKLTGLLVTLPPAPPNASNPSILSASSTSNSLFSIIFH